jgi:hypothetical protein
MDFIPILSLPEGHSTGCKILNKTANPIELSHTELNFNKMTISLACSGQQKMDSH